MTDILIDTNKDMAIAAGDIATGYSDQQHQELLLATFKGEWKEKPTMAVGAAGYLKTEDVNALLGEVKQEFERDGMTVTGLSFVNGKLNIDAHY